MSDEHDSTPPEPQDSLPPDAHRERFRRRLEGVIPELLKRAVELGVEKAQEAPDNLKQFVNDLKLPKEIAHYLLAQVDETKNGLFRVVAKEIRDFLEHTNFAGEMQRVLTTVQFEINTTIRFTPNDGRSKEKADKDKAAAKDKREGRGSIPPEPLKEEPPPPDDDAYGLEPEEERPERAERTSVMPRPEVKTAVSVRRDRRSRES